LVFVIYIQIMNTQLLERITFNPNQCGGKPCIRNMRIRVTDVIELLANGLSPEQIIADELPDLDRDDITACLLYAAVKLNHPVLQAA
jgi:uncharacterized protein (DUF433 family)